MAEIALLAPGFAVTDRCVARDCGAQAYLRIRLGQSAPVVWQFCVHHGDTLGDKLLDDPDRDAAALCDRRQWYRDRFPQTVCSVGSVGLVEQVLRVNEADELIV